MQAGTAQAAIAGAEVLLDRDGQLASLHGCWRQVGERDVGHLVLVAGEAGAGKTALLQRFWSELDSSTHVLWAACDSLATPRPLGPLMDLARAVEGELKERLDGGCPPYDVADALIRELDSYARPALLVIEDVHWADDATLDVVRLVARRAEQLEALLVFTFREEELDRFHPLRALLGDLGGHGRTTRIDVPGLTPDSVARLADGSGVDAEALFEWTAGNAFFVTESLAAGADTIPASVRDAVLARAARLSADARSVLDAVAIVPDGVEQWLLDGLTDAPAGTLEECLRSGMLAPTAAGVAFRHELARLAIEESVAPDLRLQLHRRVLAGMRQAPGGARDLTRLAYHAEAAADEDAVLEFATAAAEHAASVGAHTEAQAQYGRSLRFAGGLDPDKRAGLLERFADEGYLTDMRVGAIDAITEAIAIRESRGEAIALGRDLCKRSSLFVCAGRSPEARTDSFSALELLEAAAPSGELANALGRVCVELQNEGRLEEALRVGERGIAIAEQLGDLDALAGILRNLGATRFWNGDRTGATDIERSLALNLDAGDGPRAGLGYITLAAGHGVWREWSAADRYIEEGLAYCIPRGLTAWEECLLAVRVESELWKGSWDRVPGTVSAILAASPDWHLEPRFWAIRGQGLLRARLGQPGVWEPLDEALQLAGDNEDPDMIGEIVCARAEARWLEGDLAGVDAETSEIMGTPTGASFHNAGDIACWRRRAGLSFEMPEATLDHVRLQLEGDHRSAADAWTALGCPYDAALALADSDLAEDWRTAHELLSELGARPAAAIVARRLRESGERGLRRGPRPATRENPLGLTARQLDVLALLAEGKRNSEIAERLVLSRKTVDHHVSAILSKLDVRSRGEATAKASALGIVGRPAV